MASDQSPALFPDLLREYADRKTGYIYADEVAVLRSAADEIESLRETLAWLRFALGWEVFRESKPADLSNEMGDIKARIEKALDE